MTDALPLFAALLVGLAGSAHCIGMCGGIVGTLDSCLKIRPPAVRVVYHLIYSLGRILSYAAAGAAVGVIGARLMSWFPPERAHTLGMVLSGVFIILFGLYVSGWWNGLTILEKQGGRLWQRIAPLTRRFLPIDRPHRAFALGMLWGWLPCGLVYSALAWAATTGGAVQGALLMAAFGIGTLPMLLMMGTAVAWLDRLRGNLAARRIAGSLLLLFGVLTVSGLVKPAHFHAGGRPPAQEHAGHAHDSSLGSIEHTRRIG